jgi:hypothetical protein
MILSSYDRLGRILSVAIVAVLGACDGNTPPTLTVAMEPIGSPAGSGSGQPYLATDDGDVYLSWLEASSEGGHDLRIARHDGADWTEPTTIAHREGFFVNWADFPSVSVGPGATLWAHWLERSGAGTYAYGVRVVRSDDGGATWSEPWTPHDDDSPTEHGFVSTAAMADAVGFAWLDGRRYVEGADGFPPSHEMTLRYRSVDALGTPGPEMLVDGRVCDCCQTDSAVTEQGPVVVYRDRSDAEVRDIYIARLVDGAWTEGAPVHDDGWEIAGCPVNGPAVVADGSSVAVAWFAAPDDVARVKVAFSHDAGATFGTPTVVDDGNPGGRVDLLMMADGSVLVSWLERTGGENAEIRIRRVDPDGASSESAAVSKSTDARASGFPRMVEAGDGSIVAAWTDVGAETSHVRVTKLQLR